MDNTKEPDHVSSKATSSSRTMKALLVLFSALVLLLAYQNHQLRVRLTNLIALTSTNAGALPDTSAWPAFRVISQSGAEPSIFDPTTIEKPMIVMISATGCESCEEIRAAWETLVATAITLDIPVIGFRLLFEIPDAELTPSHAPPNDAPSQIDYPHYDVPLEGTNGLLLSHLAGFPTTLVLDVNGVPAITIVGMLNTDSIEALLEAAQP